jgi:plasmid segregation protein ParM
MSSKIMLGLDVGYGLTKAVGSTGQEFCFPSLIARVRHVDPSTGAPMFQDPTGMWLVGESAHEGTVIAPRVDSSWINDDIYRVLSLSAIDRFGVKEADLVVGLPVETFKRFHGQLPSLYQSWKTCGYKLNVLDVVPQPVGTLFDVGFDDTNWVDGLKGRVGIVDIGNGTVDCIEVYNHKMNLDRRNSRPNGVHTAYQHMVGYIMDAHKVAVAMEQMPEIARTGTVSRAGKPVSVEKELVEVKRSMIRLMKVQMQEIWGNGAQLNKIVFSGGGASFLRSEIERAFPAEQVMFPSDPSMANARGYLKVGRVVERAAAA